MSAVPTLVPLHKVAALNPPLPQRPELDELVSFLPMSAVDAGAIDVVDHDTRCFADVSKGYTPFVADDVLVAKITPCFENGKIAQAKPTHRVAFGSTEFHVVRSNRDALDPRYLAHFLRQDRIRLEGQRKMTGSAGQRRVPEHFLASLQIPLPPLPEQRRIAAILDQADALRVKRRAALAKLDELTQSIFLDMFGDPATNPKGWPRQRLENLCETADDIKCGPFGTQLAQSEYTAEGVPLWGIRHVNAGFRTPTSEFLSANTAERLRQYSILPGDIVMTRKGTVGNCAVYPDVETIGIMHSDLLRLRVHRAACVPTFLAHQLHHSRDVDRQVKMISGGAVMPGINVTKLKQLEVVMPSFPLQQWFAQRVACVRGMADDQGKSAEVLAVLFASLQHRAFRGEL
jgi:type I restriction enzyme S subunit